MEIDPKLLLKAKKYAFLLLKFRARSENEISQRLEDKFGRDVGLEVFGFLKEKKFVDDGLFARSWIESRLESGYAINRIEQELLARSIDKKIVDRELDGFREKFRDERVVPGLVEKRLQNLKGTQIREAKKNIYAYLVRRGFSPEVAMEALENL